MTGNKTKVANWIRSGMNYNEGVSFLAELTGRQFSGRENKDNRDKVAYEICKASGAADLITWRAFIKTVQSQSFNFETIETIKTKEFLSTSVANPTIETTETIETTKPLTEYPSVIRRMIHEYAQLFQERSQLHAVMTGLPESNAEAVCVKRTEMFDVIKAISERLELLYVAKAAFDKEGILPDEQVLFPPEIKAEAAIPIDESGLKKQKKNLQSGNSKDRTILDFQSKETQAFKNPMPDGPKRKKIEMRIAERNKKIEEIEILLLKYVSKE